MKKITSAMLLALTAGMTGLFMACTETGHPGSSSSPVAKSSFTPADHANFISKDSANKMIWSYLSSLDSARVADSQDLYSLIFEADDIRDYLSDTSIKNIKVMFAHTLDYINSGHQGVAAGFGSGALTVIIAGYNAQGDYVFKSNDLVLNKALPCPRSCPTLGTAVNNQL